MALRKKPAGAPTAPAPGAKGPIVAGETAVRTGMKARLSQIRAVFMLTARRDPKLVPLMAAGFLVPFAILLALGFLFGPLYLWAPVAVLIGLLVAVNLFSRRVQQVTYADLEGKPGAAAGIVERMRGDYRLTPAVQVNRHQDVVHRVVSRAGIVVIAEGRGQGARELLGNEVRRLKKLAGDVPINTIIVGTGEGEVPLPKLQSKLMRMSRTLRKPQVDQLDKRLKAATSPPLPIPKGPMPRYVPRGGKNR